MTSVIHFKFRSALLSETLNFDGDYLSLLDLKRLIAKKKGLLNAADIDFAITNKQTGEEYTKEDAFIPKNTEVLVKKINAKPQLDALRTNPSGAAAARPAVVTVGNSSESSALPFSSTAVSTADGAGEQDLDEDALLKKMIEEQNVEWQRTQQQRRATNFPPNNQKFAPGGSGAKPPSHYICNRCEKPGHWKKDCPTMGDPAFDERKFAVGVPICRTRVLADQSGAGAGLDVMRLPDGRLVQCVPAEADFEKAIGTGKQMVNVPADGTIPKELQCAITKDIAENAHILPCCQSNVSLSAVTPILEDRATCPICLQTDITLDMLKPNLRLRETVRTFLKAAIDRGIRLKRPIRQEADGEKIAPNKNTAEETSGQVLPPPSENPQQDMPRAADDLKLEVGRQTNAGLQDLPHVSIAGGNVAQHQQNSGRDGQGRTHKRAGKRRKRNRGQGGGQGGGGQGGGGGTGAPFAAHAGMSAPFYAGGAMPYNSQGMMMNRSGQQYAQAGYGGMRNMAPQMQMYMNPMGMQRMMPPWPGRPMMMPVHVANGQQGLDDDRESSYESSSCSRSRSRGRSWSGDRSRSRSRDRDRRRGERGRSRDSRRDDRDRRDRSRSWSRDKERVRDRSVRRKDSRGEVDNLAEQGQNIEILGESVMDESKEMVMRKSRDKDRSSHDEKSRRDRDRSRDRGRGRDSRDRDRVDRDRDRQRGEERDRERNRDDWNRDRSRERPRDEREHRSRANRNRDTTSTHEDSRRRTDTKEGSRGNESSDRARQESKTLTPEEESRIRRFGTKDLVLFSKSEASRNMASVSSDVGELRSKRSERRSMEASEHKSESSVRNHEEEAEVQDEVQDRSESVSTDRDRKKRDRLENDSTSEVVGEETPGLYMDSVQKRKSRDPIQPYRPPIALLSKKAAAGQERSRTSPQVSVLDRLGAAPATDADASSLRKSRSSGSSSSKRMRGSGADVTVTVRL